MLINKHECYALVLCTWELGITTDDIQMFAKLIYRKMIFEPQTGFKPDHRVNKTQKVS